MSEEWTKTLDEGHTVDVIDTDFAKAFYSSVLSVKCTLSCTGHSRSSLLVPA